MRLSRAFAIAGAVACVLLVLPSSAQANHNEGSFPTRVWCAVRVSNVNEGASFSWWYSCTTGGGKQFRVGERIAQAVHGEFTDNGQDNFPSFAGATAPTLSNGDTNAQATGTDTWPTNPLIGRPYNVSAEPPGLPNTGFPNANFAVGQGSFAGPSATGSVFHGVIESVSVGTGFPAFPPFGGTPPTVPPEGSCAVLAEQRGEGFYRARLRVTVENHDNVGTYVIDTDHGDGTATEHPTTSVAYWHYFPTPDPGETYVVTHTIDSADHPDETCTTDVNFFNDALDTGTFAGGSEDSGEDDDPEDGAGSCGFFDVVCWLKKLFVPDGDALSEKAAEVSASAEANWPVAPLFWLADEAGNAGEDIESGTGGTYGGLPVANEGPCGKAIHLDFPAEGGDITVPIFEGVNSSPGCPATSSPVGWLSKITHLLSTIAAALMGFFVIRRAVATATGSGGGEA